MSIHKSWIFTAKSSLREAKVFFLSSARTKKVLLHGISILPLFVAQFSVHRKDKEKPFFKQNGLQQHRDFLALVSLGDESAGEEKKRKEKRMLL